MTPPPTLLPEKLAAERYSVNVRTLRRWDLDPSVDFPPPVIIRKRRYRDLQALEAWDDARRSGRAA
jgi:hypothetical protein